MDASGTTVDRDWGMLEALPEEQRASRMSERYRALASLPDPARLDQVLAMTRAEYALSDDKLRSFTVSRLRAWLQLEPEVAQKIVASYDAAMLKMPGTQAMRRIALVQTLAREFSLEERDRLIALIPAVFGGAEAVTAKYKFYQKPEPPTPSAPAKRGWWPFGKR